MKKKLLLSKSKLLYLYRDKNLSSFAIARDFGCSAGTVINRMRQYNIKSRHSGPRRVNISKDALYLLYVKRGFSATKIARICHCEQTAILNRLKKYNIPLVNAKRKVIISKERLSYLYFQKELSTYKIANILGCESSTVYRYLKVYGVKPRHLKRINIPINSLKKLYFNEKLSLKKIAQMYYCSAVTVMKHMDKFNLKRRTLSETSTKHFKRDFDGNDNLKSYMVGFRLGDLGVRKKRKIIAIGCGTTKDVQMELIKSLFSKYGPIFMSNKNINGVMHIDCSLNKSFSFLLPKHTSIPKWIFNNKSNFWSFLAGYTDAEGNICISMNMAKFRIRTYDKSILWQIHSKLNQYYIKSMFRLESKAGLKKDRLQNKDCWGVTISEKVSLLKVLSFLEPMLKHSKRQNDLANALLNVKRRLRIYDHEKAVSY